MVSAAALHTFECSLVTSDPVLAVCVCVCVCMESVLWSLLAFSAPLRKLLSHRITLERAPVWAQPVVYG